MQTTDQCYDATFPSCFESSAQCPIPNPNSILSSHFFTSHRKTIKLVLHSNCIVMTQEQQQKPMDKVQVFTFTSRSSFQMVRGPNEKNSKYKGLIFYNGGQIEARDTFYCANQELCGRWNDALSALLSQKGFTQNYQLIDFIGKGHSSRVYTARKRDNDEIVAVKIFKRRSDKRSEQAFLNEIRILREVSHPNVLKLRGSFNENESIYAVTEYCSGGTLYSEITTKANYTKEEQTKIIIDLTSAVEHLRTLRIVHRDIKLENVFIRKELNEQSYVLGDFGLAAYLDEKTPIFETCGTVGYTAPEILRHSGNKPLSLSHKMDTFPLGVIYHIVLLKRTVFQYNSGDMKELASLNKRCFINWKLECYTKMPKEELELLQCTLTENPQNRFTTKEILSLPFFKKHAMQLKKRHEESESNTINSNSTCPNSNHSMFSSKSSSLLTTGLKNIFAPKYKRVGTVKVESKDKWSILSWFKSEEKENSEANTKYSLEDGFVEEKKSKERFFEDF